MIVPLTIEIAQRVAQTLCARDRQEVEAMLPEGAGLNAWASGIVGNRDAESFAAVVIDDADQMAVPVPVAMGGISLQLPWVGAAWFVGTDRKLEAGPEIFKAALRLHREWRERGIRKFIVNCLHSPELSSDWMERLGYRREGFVHKLGRNGEDFVSWGIE